MFLLNIYNIVHELFPCVCDFYFLTNLFSVLHTYQIITNPNNQHNYVIRCELQFVKLLYRTNAAYVYNQVRNQSTAPSNAKSYLKFTKHALCYTIPCHTIKCRAMLKHAIYAMPYHVILCYAELKKKHSGPPCQEFRQAFNQSLT